MDATTGRLSSIPSRRNRSPRASLAGTLAAGALFAYALLFGWPPGLDAQEASYAGAVAAETRLEWDSGELVVKLSLDIVKAGLRLPAARSEAERILERMAPSIVKETILSIQVDSYRKVSDTLDDGSIDPAELRAFLDAGTRLRAVMSQDARRLETEYRWSLPALAALYARHGAAIALQPSSRYVATRPYSGIVIYVRGELPVRGEQLAARPNPCLLPRIYDDKMNLILDRYRVEAERFAFGLPVAYAYSLSDPVIEARAGGDPLRILASALFGSMRTDAVIPEAEALKILADPANRELVRLGRVVFVFLPD